MRRATGILRRTAPVAVGFCLLLGVAAVLALLPAAQATHIWGGSLWNTPDPSPDSLEVTFEGWWGERYDGCGCAVGDVRTGPLLEFGDGETVRPEIVVTSVSATDNYWTGDLRSPGGGRIKHTYESAENKDQAWEARLIHCCRLAPWSNGGLDAHTNNPDEEVRIGTTIDLGKKQGHVRQPSPVLTTSPVQVCIRESDCIIPLGVQATGNVRFRLPAGGEAQEQLFARPGERIGNHQAYVGSSGTVAWNTRGLLLDAPGWNYFSMHAVAEQERSSAAVDFMIRVAGDPILWDRTVSNCSGVGYQGPVDAATVPPWVVEVWPKDQVELSMTALSLGPSDSIGSLAIHLAPQGVASVDDAPGNPSTIHVRWTPTGEDAGLHSVVVRAFNRTGTYSVDCMAMVRVLPVEAAPKVAWRVIGYGPEGAFVRLLDDGGYTDAEGRTLERLWRLPKGTVSGDGPLVFLAYGTHGVCVDASLRINQHVVDATDCIDIPIRTPVNDADQDGVADRADNCVETSNRDQADSDLDGVGDACDAPGQAPPFRPEATAPGDRDGDGVGDGADGCPDIFDPMQADQDADGIGDACDEDLDGDGVPQFGPGADNCPFTPNPDQADLDGDGHGDVCQHMPLEAGPAAPRMLAALDETAPRPSPGFGAPALFVAGAVAAVLVLALFLPRRRP